MIKNLDDDDDDSTLAISARERKTRCDAPCVTDLKPPVESWRRKRKGKRCCCCCGCLYKKTKLRVARLRGCVLCPKKKQVMRRLVFVSQKGKCVEKILSAFLPKVRVGKVDLPEEPKDTYYRQRERAKSQKQIMWWRKLSGSSDKEDVSLVQFLSRATNKDDMEISSSLCLYNKGHS